MSSLFHLPLPDKFWRTSLPLIFTFVFASATDGAEFQITPQTDLKPVLKKVVAGDSLILRDGEWKDADLTFEQLNGMADSLISIRAQTPGKAVFTGRCRFRVSGRHIVVSGLVFRNPHGVSDVVQLRTHSERHAHHCRITDCVIEEGEKPAASSESRWMSVYGTHNRIDHCYFVGKKNKGTTLVVWVADDMGDHRIDHNHFGPRPELGRNGGETLRIGTSEVSELPSRTIVEENYFHRCDGEAEIVSNKSCENIYRHNVFDQCGGTLTLRHGHRCHVDGNAFLGRKQSGTGGVRIIGKSHVVVNNYFEGLRGDAERAALCMMNGIPNSPLNKYSPVKDAVVSHNCFVDCKVSLELGVGAGKKQPAAPADSRFSHNIFLPGKWELSRLHAAPVNATWEANLQQSGQDRGHDLADAINCEFRDLGFERGADGLLRPTNAASVRVETETAVKTDIDGDSRGESVSSGCDEPQGKFRTWVTASTTGPKWRGR